MGALARSGKRMATVFPEAGESPRNDLKIALHTFDAVTNHELEMSSRLRRSTEGPAVPLSETFSGTDQDIALLALGFARGETGSLVVPYARRGTA